MTKTDILTEIKYGLSILAYVFVVYPIKRIILPVISILIDESYLLATIFMFYMLMYLYDFDMQRIATEFSTKLVYENIESIIWFISPLVTIGSIEITPAHLVLAILGTFLIVRLYRLFRVLFNRFKMVAGDVLIVILWCYFRVVGNKEQSVMLITSEEAKHKIVMYLIIGLVIIVSLVMVLAPNLMLNYFIPVNAPNQIILNNTSIETPEYLKQLVIP